MSENDFWQSVPHVSGFIDQSDGSIKLSQYALELPLANLSAENKHPHNPTLKLEIKNFETLPGVLWRSESFYTIDGMPVPLQFESVLKLANELIYFHSHRRRFTYVVVNKLV